VERAIICGYVDERARRAHFNRQPSPLPSPRAIVQPGKANICMVFKKRSAITSELTRRRKCKSSFRVHHSSLQFTLPPLASNDLFDGVPTSRGSFMFNSVKFGFKDIKRFEEWLCFLPESFPFLWYFVHTKMKI